MIWNIIMIPIRHAVMIITVSSKWASNHLIIFTFSLLSYFVFRIRYVLFISRFFPYVNVFFHSFYKFSAFRSLLSTISYTKYIFSFYLAFLPKLFYNRKWDFEYIIPYQKPLIWSVTYSGQSDMTPETPGVIREKGEIRHPQKIVGLYEYHEKDHIWNTESEWTRI